MAHVDRVRQLLELQGDHPVESALLEGDVEVSGARPPEDDPASWTDGSLSLRYEGEAMKGASVKRKVSEDALEQLRGVFEPHLIPSPVSRPTRRSQIDLELNHARVAQGRRSSPARWLLVGSGASSRPARRSYSAARFTIEPDDWRHLDLGGARADAPCRRRAETPCMWAACVSWFRLTQDSAANGRHE